MRIPIGTDTYFKHRRKGGLTVRRLILFFMLILLMALLASCSSGETNGDKDSGDDGKHEIDQTIKIPTSESFGRDVINFGMISYKRPDVKVLEENLSSLTKMIEEAEASFDAQMASLRPTLKALSTFLTAYTYVSIKHSSNTQDSYYKTEYEHLSKEYQSITESAEALYTAAASSPYAVRFEEEYFGEGFIEKYAEASKVTDNLSLLIDNERRLEEIYSKISPSTVHITCDGIYGSYDAVMRALESKYADSPEMLTVQRALAESLYKEQRRITAMDTFLTLVKVRRLIAEELGYESYTHYAYSNLNHGYTPEQYKKFIDDTVKYAVPVYRKLHNQVFNSYFKNNSPSEILVAYTVNILSDVYKQMSEDIYGVYAYMLYYGMFDIKPSASTRKDGSFTVYLEEYDSPYLFLSASSNMEDFLTLSGSFGIFCDKFINNNSSGSVDITEASSIGMQLLTLIGLGDHA